MRFVSNITSYAYINKKAADIDKWIKDFKFTLFNTEKDFHRFHQQLMDKVEELNRLYPRTAPFVVHACELNGDQCRLTIGVEGSPEKTVLYLDIHKVIRIFK